MNIILKKLGPVANIDFNKLFIGQLFAHFSDAIVQFTLVAILLEKLPSAGRAIALTFFAFLLPQFLFSPFTGSVSDKFSRKLILFLSSAFRGLILTIALITFLKSDNISTIYIYALSFILGLGSTFFYPAKMAIVTNIVENSQLKFANALNSSIGSLAILFGAFISNCLVQRIGAYDTLIAISICYFTSGLFCLAIKLQKPQGANNVVISMFKDMKTAFDYLKKHKKALYLVLLSFFVEFIVSTFSNNLNNLVTDFYKLDFSDLTYLRTILGIGIILGMFLTIYFSRFMKIIHLFSLGFLILFITLFTANFCNSLNIAWKWLIPIGITDAMIVVMLDTVLQKVTPDKVRGKIFGLSLTTGTLSSLIGSLVIIWSSGFINPLITFKLIACFTFLLALCILLFDKTFRYFLLKNTIGRLFLILFKYKVEGIENLPKNGKVILAGNHTGHLDAFIIQMATKRNLWFVTGPEAFKIPIIKYLLKLYNVLPLQFGKGLEAIEAGVTKLKQGEAVIIFPEGKFTPDGNLCKFNRGTAIMAKHANCPIVPFAIKGGFETWNKKRRLPKFFNTLVIQFGQPINDLSLDEKELTNELRSRVNFMKQALERRAFYKISEKTYSNFLDLIQDKGDEYAPVEALSIKTKIGYKSLTYIELSRNAKKFANYLIETIGVQRKDRIAILTESRPEFGIALFASIQTGAITVPLDVKLTVYEHTNILSDCEPIILCCSSHYYEHAKEIQKNVTSIKHIFVIDKDESNDGTNIFDINADIEKDLGRPRSFDETALIVYTSGTTGNPKGVMISFANIYSQFKDFEKIFELSPHNCLLSILPLNHLLELTDGFFSMLYMGARIVYIQSLNPRELTDTMKEKGITNMIVVPLVAKMLKNSIEKQINRQGEKAKRAFDHLFKIAKYMPRKIRRLLFKQIIDGLGGKLECFISGGAPLESSIAEFFDRIGIPVFQGYGLTETSPTVSTNYYNNNRIGTVGKPLPSVKIKIADNGELLVAGMNVMQGYYKKPEMTAEVIDEDGWFHTGDIAEVDSDGYIKITGRIKNMIVLGGGKKIFPEEVEAVLETSDKIKEVCVLSLKIKSGNKAGTEEVGAIIVPTDDIINNDNLQEIIENEVKELAAKNLAPYKIPTLIIIHKDELPKTSTRKVKRKELLDWYENQNKE
ncbi:MFS transporter [bacterium]|nr:MFS transporter [bacterium]